ncbi:unnamed protein product [Calypogeia fissa]
MHLGRFAFRPRHEQQKADERPGTSHSVCLAARRPPQRRKCRAGVFHTGSKGPGPTGQQIRHRIRAWADKNKTMSFSLLARSAAGSSELGRSRAAGRGRRARAGGQDRAVQERHTPAVDGLGDSESNAPPFQSLFCPDLLLANI